MFKSFLKRAKSETIDDATTPDISRVLPEYNRGAARIVPKTQSLSPTARQPATGDAPGEAADAAPAPRTDASPLVLDAGSIVAAPESPTASPPAGTSETARADNSERTPPAGEDWLQADLAALREAADAFLAETGDERDRRALFLIAHNMRGAAGAYGFPVIERITASLCQMLEHDNDPHAAGALIHLHVEACRAAAKHNSARASVDLADAVCTALEDQVSARLSGWG